MSREIKFRAYDKGTGTMVFEGFHLMGEVMAFGGIEDHIANNMLGAASSLERWIDIVVMQYTGLKDKNGKEMCEGDVVVTSGCQNLISGETENDLCVVEYNGPHLCYCDYYANEGESARKRTYVFDLIGGADQDYDAEIIGNIYDNPELIEP